MSIPYSIRTSRRARYVRISVSCDGTVSVTQPFRVPRRIVEAFVAQKEHWIRRRLAFFQNAPLVRHRATRADYLARKRDSRFLVLERIAHWNQCYRFPFRRVTIRSQKTRWGSCSRSGTLSFNYRIVYLARELQDYLIVHELCHLQELNHSEKFWALVGRSIPDYRLLRSRLSTEILS